MTTTGMYPGQAPGPHSFMPPPSFVAAPSFQPPLAAPSNNPLQQHAATASGSVNPSLSTVYTVPSAVPPSNPPANTLHTELAQAPISVPGEVTLVWTDEEYSMEERRAELPKYKVLRRANVPASTVVGGS